MAMAIREYVLRDPQHSTMPACRRIAIWYLNNNVYVNGAYGPTRLMGWSLVALNDQQRLPVV
jgi:hypothetical protein